MTKSEFLDALRERLKACNRSGVDEQIQFYGEMIDDRVEDGVAEEEAVAAIGTVEDIVARILGEGASAAGERGERPSLKRRMSVGTIVLLAVGSPLWLSLVLTIAVIVLALTVSAWAVVVSLWAAFASTAATAVGAILFGVASVGGENPLAGVAMVGAGIALAGVSIFLFFASNQASKGLVRLMKTCARGIKNRFLRKEAAR